MKLIEFHPEAEAELLGAQQWYRERSDVAAQAFALEIDAAIGSIIEAPERWPVTSRGERHRVLPRFPFTIYYRVHSDTVYIIAMAHQRRRPNYWRGRR